ncbi:MAG: GEVED domain-containing protein, partial [Rubripirellula sp.]
MRRKLFAEQLEDRRLLAVSFEFNYLGGSSVGFNDPTEGSTFRGALESAATRLGGWLLHDATIQLDVVSEPFDGTGVAKASSEPAPSLPNGGFRHDVIPAKVLGQGDLNGAEPDGRVEVFFFGPSDVFTYETDPAEVNADDEIDFQAVIIHELVHTLGFTSATNANGSDDGGQGISTPGTWSVYDQFLSDVDGNRLIDADPDSPTAFQIDNSPTGWPLVSVGGPGPAGGLFFDGPIATAVYGGRVPLFSPSTFQLESSVSHLDSEGFPGDSVFSPLTHLMSHAIVDNNVPQDLTLVEKAILADIGIMVRENVPPQVSAPPNLVLEGNSEGGFLGLNQAFADYLDSAVATDLLDTNPTLANNRPPFLQLGQNVITFTATDASGNSQSDTSVVSVFDTTPPEISVSPLSVSFEATGVTGVTDVTLPFQITASDIVDPNPVVSFDSGNDFVLGTTTATYTARDFRNNEASFDVEIMVVDTTAPEFTLPASISIDTNLAGSADLNSAMLIDLLSNAASDIADDSLTFTADVQSFSPGTNMVTFTATDDSGNFTNATTMLTVVDVSIVVTTLDDELDTDPQNDPDDISLREALSIANAQAGVDTVRFQEGLSGDVLLDSALGQLLITESVNLVGLGRDLTTISGQMNHRVLEISDAAMDVLIDGVTIANGRTTADTEGGAGVRLSSTGTLTVANSAITGNQSSGLGGIGAGLGALTGSFVILDSLITDNVASGDFSSGAGVWSAGEKITIERSILSGNRVTGGSASGAAVYSLGAEVNISGSTLSGNVTEGSGGGGGAAAVLNAPLTIRDSTFSGNSTEGSGSHGGAIRAVQAPLKVSNSTVSGNDTSATNARGGGIYARRSDVEIHNSTVTGNSSLNVGGGIAIPDNPSLNLIIQNSIIAANTDDGTAPDFLGIGALENGASVRHSLIGDNAGTTLAESQMADPVTGNFVGDSVSGAGAIDPLLAALADNGGSTQTQLPMEGSLAINGGDPAFDPTSFDPALFTDQRGAGFPRLSGRQVDIGAIEVTGDYSITWQTPAAIPFGTPLDDTQLNAESSIPGTFVYDPIVGTVLNAGENQMLTATFTPDDTLTFDPTTVTVFITVTQVESILTWANPEPILFGTELDATQLNATASVPGTFAYTPDFGSVIDVGTNQPLSVTFTPTDNTNFSGATATVFIDVNQATPVLSWENPEDVVFGTPLGSSQLDATASVPGTFSYVPPAGVLLSAGVNQTLNVTFTPDSANFESVFTTVTINVERADPVITWAEPSDILFGTELSEAQLNADADVSGVFTYDPVAGTVLQVGDDQTLTATFTPSNLNNFNSGSATVTINVVSSQDFGDAPLGFPVTLAEDGARHTPSSLLLGELVDTDDDGVPSAAADSDGADDDGVAPLTDMVAASDAETAASLTVLASEPGKLDGWIDFNQDGDWEDAGEQVFVSVDVTAGSNPLRYVIPAGASAGETFARFRISADGGLGVSGSVSGGEVEDYALTVLDGGSSP